MSTDHAGDIRGFSILSEAYYAKACMRDDHADSITIGMYCPDGGTSGEFSVNWKRLGKETCPRLEVFNDAWSALQHFGDMLQWMARHDNEPTTPQQFANMLRELGITDRTHRVGPTADPSPAELEYASWIIA